MALLFGAASSDRVSHGNASELNDNIICSTAWWVRYNASAVAYQYLADKSPNSDNRFRCQMGATVGAILVSVKGGGNLITYSASNIIPTQDKWYFVGITLEGDAGVDNKVEFYVGDLTTQISSFPTSGVQDNPVTTRTDNTVPLLVGNDNGLVSTWEGDIAFFAYWDDVVLTEDDYILQQYHLHSPIKPADNSVFSHYGLQGTGNQPDWSGNGNHGTVTGATQAAHVPLPIFPPVVSFMGESIAPTSIVLDTA